jgi:hypothetical protein
MALAPRTVQNIRQQDELQRALQLELPIPMGPRIPILYVEMDGTGSFASWAVCAKFCFGIATTNY